MLCKADDLRVCFINLTDGYENRSLEFIREEIVGRISSTLGKQGHNIKQEESYGSQTYFAPLRLPASINMIELPQTTRKLQNTYGASPAFIATRRLYKCQISNCRSACKASVQTVGPYCVALL